MTRRCWAEAAATRRTGRGGAEGRVKTGQRWPRVSEAAAVEVALGLGQS